MMECTVCGLRSDDEAKNSQLDGHVGYFEGLQYYDFFFLHHLVSGYFRLAWLHPNDVGARRHSDDLFGRQDGSGSAAGRMKLSCKLIDMPGNQS